MDFTETQNREKAPEMLRLVPVAKNPKSFK